MWYWYELVMIGLLSMIVVYYIKLYLWEYKK